MSWIEGKVAVVTGANAGIGLETARGLARAGARVVMAARNRAKGEAAVADVKATTGRDEVELLDLDLASLASVRAAAATLLERHAQIPLLVNNAGLIMGARETTEDGFEATLGINHLGHFLFTLLLVERIQASAPARIVNLSSEAHRGSRGLDFDDLMRERRSYGSFPAYSDSKLANILFTRELARRLEGTGVVTHAVHPGVVGTRFGRDGDLKGPFAWLIAIGRPLLLTPAKGARTSLHVALEADAAASSGDYWSRSRRVSPTAQGSDDRAARRLWEASEALVGLTGAEAGLAGAAD